MATIEQRNIPLNITLIIHVHALVVQNLDVVPIELFQQGHDAHLLLVDLIYVAIKELGKAGTPVENVCPVFLVHIIDERVPVLINDLGIERWIIVSMMVICSASDIEGSDRRRSELSDAPLNVDYDNSRIEQ